MIELLIVRFSLSRIIRSYLDVGHQHDHVGKCGRGNDNSH